MPDSSDPLRTQPPDVTEGATGPPPNGPATEPPPGNHPQWIGPYRVECLLGEGGFGRVYRAWDLDLQRWVAIKLPHAHLVSRREDAELYLEEARTVASLDHDHIVQVFHVGSTPEHPFFAVSRFIEGTTLSKRLRGERPAWRDTIELLSKVADALHYAHCRGVVHRDVKPGNILLDKAGKPYVADFGLALRDQGTGQNYRYAGTPEYMSPEQARGEGHRVDGRSDIFSLGAVLYVMTTARKPFEGKSRTEVMELVANHDPRPPRQVDDTIPKELERICLKALSKRAADRYPTARDLADELRAVRLDETTTLPPTPTPVPDSAALTPPVGRTGPPGSSLPAATPSAETTPVRIVPKGLRAFDAGDRDFFLELLPGPRDREGLPDSIRFWKARIEQADPAETFPVGLLYGPSGCGKSSLVKAGLLPRLAPDVLTVYVEATASDTESRLLAALHRRCPELCDRARLKDALSTLRQGALPGKKVLLVLDQFEQWLHGRRGEERAELARALRQCDGGSVQALLLVRDDFWLAISRFMRDLEIPLLEGENSALADLFDLDHARKVLAAFGRAFGRLPEKQADTTKQQKEFLSQAVAGLAVEGKVVCVRLALFAEMMKGRPWTPASLRAVGGTEGVGVTFLEETFAGSTAPPQHRLHQHAARAVLRTLLPESGADIKGTMRPEAALRAASGYADRARDFADLLQILDRDTRLITPTDPEGRDPHAPAPESGRYYQLTHDYLVPSVRNWLSRKQRETARGRAELRLEERAAIWSSKRETRLLPSLWDWSRFQLLTHSSGWTPTQHEMMRQAGRRHGMRAAIGIAALAVAALAGWKYLERVEVYALRDRLLSAAMAEVPGIVDAMSKHRGALEPVLREARASETDPKRKLLISLALLPSDHNQVAYVYEQLLEAEPQDFAIIRQALATYKDELTPRLWAVFSDEKTGDPRRFRAACALADYVRQDPRWMNCASLVIDGLLSENPLVLNHWRDALEPVRSRLLPALAASLEDSKWGPADRRAITDFYRAFSAAEPEPFAPLEARLSNVDTRLGTDGAKQKANVAAALIALGHGEKAWRLLVHTPFPTLRSYLIERLGLSGVDPKALLARLQTEKDTSARRALILAIGNFALARLPEAVPLLMDLYENDPDSGVHGATSWTLRTWGQGQRLRTLDNKFAKGTPPRGRNWYLAKNGRTFSLIPMPGGQAPTRDDESRQAPPRLAICAEEVTVGDFHSFRPGHKVDDTVATTPDSPVNMVSWYDAAEYCNWLSKQEGIPEAEWCYRRNESGLLNFVPNYRQRTGYRLPTEAEWVFACRAGAESSCSFGDVDEELAGRYAWWFGNSRANGNERCFPIDLLKSNDWGLFDIQGNVAEWCQESATTNPLMYYNDIEVVARGGYYSSHLQWLGTEKRFRFGRKNFARHIGFRVARTVR